MKAGISGVLVAVGGLGGLRYELDCFVKCRCHYVRDISLRDQQFQSNFIVVNFTVSPKIA